MLAVVGTLAVWGGVQEFQHETSALRDTVRAAALDVAMGADAALARTRVYPSEAGTFGATQTTLPAVHMATGVEYRITNVDDDGLGATAQARRSAEPDYVCTVELGRHAAGAAPVPVCSPTAYTAPDSLIVPIAAPGPVLP